MKKLFIPALLLLFTPMSYSQDISPAKVYKNELGVDVTGFIKNILPSSNGQFVEYYVPTYYITYRRHFKPGNIRSAIGGSYLSNDISPAFALDSNSYHNLGYSLDFRLGWEFISELSKRWQLYYGLDFRPTLLYSKNDAPYWNGGYANGREFSSRILGFAPILGFRWRLNHRISLTTETSLALNFEQRKNRNYFIPVTSQYPSLPDIEDPVEKKIYTSFSQPLSIIFTIDL
jgi:hypothetical protein